MKEKIFNLRKEKFEVKSYSEFSEWVEIYWEIKEIGLLKKKVFNNYI